MNDVIKLDDLVRLLAKTIQEQVLASYRLFLADAAKELRAKVSDDVEAFYDELDRSIMRATPWYNCALGALMVLGVSSNANSFAKEVGCFEGVENVQQALLILAYYAMRQDLLEELEKLGVTLDFEDDLLYIDK